jgi:hypothetical protein
VSIRLLRWLPVARLGTNVSAPDLTIRGRCDVARFGIRHWLLATVLAVLVLGVMVPAHAGYDKFYRFKNTTGSTQSAVRAIMLGTEIIGAQYGYDATFNPWGEGTQGLQNYGGLYCSTLKWPGDNPANVANGTVLKLGWNSTDHSLQLCDLRWLNADGTKGSTITPTNDNSSVPGGGVLTYDGTNYYWTITNDTDGTILLARPDGVSTVEVGSFCLPLDWSALDQIAGNGMCTTGINFLRLAVMVYDAAGLIPDPSATSLLKKLDKAAAELGLALAAYDDGDTAAFEDHRDAAVKAMQTFVSELLRTSKIPPDLRNDLAAQGNDEIGRLNKLPDVYVPQGYGTVPLELALGESFTLTIPATSVCVGDSLVMHGTLLGADGTLDWVDHAVIKADLESPTLAVDPPEAEVKSLDDVPGAWYDGKTNWTVTLSADDVGSGVAGLIVIEDGTPLTPGSVTLPKEWTLASEDLTLFCVPGSSWTQTYSSGAHTIAAVAVDYAGNLSKEKIIKVGVDTGPPVIAWYGGLTDPDRLWSPDHTLRPVQLLYEVLDDNPGWTASLTVTSNEDENGTGDGDYPMDIWYHYYLDNGEDSWVWEGDPLGAPADSTQDAWNLLLRSERSGTLTGRWYTISVTATDVAGNTTTSGVMIPVSHDQSTTAVSIPPPE